MLQQDVRLEVDLVAGHTIRQGRLPERVGDQCDLEPTLVTAEHGEAHAVDGVGKLDAITPDGDWVLYRFRAPKPIWPYLVEKGSIAVDGVSLTVFRCQEGRFQVALIPHTLRQTTLADRVPGNRVNLEADVLLKHIESLLRARRRAR